VTTRGVFAHTAVVTALNPKGIVFFVAFVPQFLIPEAALLPQFAILTATFVSLATLNTLAYARAAPSGGPRSSPGRHGRADWF